MNTLRRYKRHYKLQLKPGTNKIQLVEVSQCVVYLKQCTENFRLVESVNKSVSYSINLLFVVCNRPLSGNYSA